MDPTHWINTVSLDHVELGVAGGFTQAGHGRPTPLRRLRRGDRLVFYSPRTALQSGQPLQRFTALGTIADDEPYQVRVGAAWRRRMEFEAWEPAEVRPLLPRLSFITDQRRWGLPFRRGLFPVTAADFAVIAEAGRGGPGRGESSGAVSGEGGSIGGIPLPSAESRRLSP